MRPLTATLSVLLLCSALGAQQAASTGRVTIRNIAFNGLAPIPPADQERIVVAVQEHTYTRESLPETSGRVRQQLQDRGYFKARVPAPTITVVSNDSRGELVDLELDVNLGQQYFLKQIVFTNNHVFTAGQLRESFPLDDGAIFDTSKVRQGLEDLRRKYTDRGYINFTSVPETVVDEPAATIRLMIDLQEGAQYRAGALMLDGVEGVPGAAAKLHESWKQYQGRVFNEAMIKSFMLENAAYLPQHKTDWQLFDISQDSGIHVVNVRLQLGNAPTNR